MNFDRNELFIFDKQQSEPYCRMSKVSKIVKPHLTDLTHRRLTHCTHVPLLFKHQQLLIPELLLIINSFLS